MADMQQTHAYSPSLREEELKNKVAADWFGAFDAEKIAFLPYNAVLDVLGKNDFDWTVAPSDHESKELKELYALAKGVIEREKLLFRFADSSIPTWSTSSEKVV